MHAYREAFFRGSAVSLASVRAGNVIGGGDWAPERLIPDCARAVRAGQPIRLRSPRAVRPWQYVLDPLSGYLWLAERQWSDAARFSGPWNFGPSGAGEKDVQQVVSSFVRHMDRADWVVEAVPDPDGFREASILRLDSSKAKRDLGWTAVTSLEQAIEATASWFLRHAENPGDTRRLCDEALERHERASGAAGSPWTASVPTGAARA